MVIRPLPILALLQRVCPHDRACVSVAQRRTKLLLLVLRPDHRLHSRALRAVVSDVRALRIFEVWALMPKFQRRAHQ